MLSRQLLSPRCTTSYSVSCRHVLYAWIVSTDALSNWDFYNRAWCKFCWCMREWHVCIFFIFAVVVVVIVCLCFFVVCYCRV